ncbi:hypothetical protein [Flavobacterium franklandianum]|uniref:Uncharacterized protein n=1 Tax=Flavobacterium franklandianum TaxID=2594430 RepID=A0A553C5V6_9FLAO|nr:hypothetical protein [Flavobacterium franklandianum]TRX15917.1 hypothetical protein FNW17_15795 [Flavobacterium franklandianum]
MIRETLLTDWNLMRILRLGLGSYVSVQAVETQSTISMIFAVFLLFQAFSNTGCGSNGCAIPIKKNNSNKTEEIEYEEVK